MLKKDTGRIASLKNRFSKWTEPEGTGSKILVWIVLALGVAAVGVIVGLAIF